MASNNNALFPLYVEELQDLWSANDQMRAIVGEMASEASDDTLADRLRYASDGISRHIKLLQELLQDAGGEAGKEHCRGMEGLVSEARKHALQATLDGAARDVAIIAQYQRMCHYGIAGFGTAKAYAEALGEHEHVRKLDQALDKIYDSDEFMSDLAERSKNLEAATAE